MVVVLLLLLAEEEEDLVSSSFTDNSISLGVVTRPDSDREADIWCKIQNTLR